MKALHVAASGMNAQQTRIDNIANNLANVNTTGFKKSREAFEDMFYQELTHGGESASTARVEVGSGVKLAGIEKDHSAGALTQTDNPLHMAVVGDGYFVVKNALGEPLYTRDGTFTLNADGQLVTQNGNEVAGDIMVPMDATALEVTQDGTVQVILEGDTDYTVLGQIEVATFVHAAGLRSVGGNTFEETTQSGQAEFAELGGEISVQQGFLESSNVDVAEELIEMIMAQRSYELNSKVVQAADETLQLAANLKR